jgi:hypothetical protein
MEIGTDGKPKPISYELDPRVFNEEVAGVAP